MRHSIFRLPILLAAMFVVGVTPGVSSASGYQRFIVVCDLSHAAPDDPIVAPGVERGSHLHEFFGNDLTDEHPGYRRMRTGTTSCAHPGDTGAYWVPALRNTVTGAIVHATSARIYYYATAAMDDEPVVAFPKGYAAISEQASWMCRNTERLSSPPDCTGRLTQASGVGIVVVFDQVCWDQVSPGRRADLDWDSHVEPLASGGCAPGRVQLPWVSMQVRYDVVDASDYEVVSEPMRGPHGDLWNTWRQSDLRALVARCLQPTSIDCGEVQG
jgi:uncharacterized protein DUF1996